MTDPKMFYYFKNQQKRYPDGSLLGIYTDTFDPNLYFFPNYIIYPDGRIYNLDTCKFLTPSISTKGYYKVTLTNYVRGVFGNLVAVSKIYSVHRLVAINFIEKTGEDYLNNRDQVNHISGDKSDNSVQNLEFVNCQENIEHAIRNGLHINPNYYDIKPAIIEEFKRGMTLAVAEQKYGQATQYGISRSTLQNYKIEAVGYSDIYDFAKEKTFIGQKLSEGYIPTEIFKMLKENGSHISECSVFKYARSLFGYDSGRTNYREHYEEIDKMILAGHTPQEIGEKFGVKPATIRKRANKKYGIYYSK